MVVASVRSTKCHDDDTSFNSGYLHSSCLDSLLAVVVGLGGVIWR